MREPANEFTPLSLFVRPGSFVDRDIWRIYALSEHNYGCTTCIVTFPIVSRDGWVYINARERLQNYPRAYTD